METLLKASLFAVALGAAPALAAPHLLDEEDLASLGSGAVYLADYHPARPVGPPPPPPRPYAPYAPAPVVSVGPDLFLLGLGLAAGGLVLGAGGFALLYACQEGTSCYSEGITILGWVLAAPGLIPLGIGLFLMYLGSGSRMRVEAPVSSPQRWAFGFTPLQGGGFVSAGTRF